MSSVLAPHAVSYVFRDLATLLLASLQPAGYHAPEINQVVCPDYIYDITMFEERVFHDRDEEARKQAAQAVIKRTVHQDKLGNAVIKHPLTGVEYCAGKFVKKSLKELREETKDYAISGKKGKGTFSVVLSNGKVSETTDIAALQYNAEPGTTFQIASNFNCLEGYLDCPLWEYVDYKPQGQVASVSCAAGTFMRRYEGHDTFLARNLVDSHNNNIFVHDEFRLTSLNPKCGYFMRSQIPDDVWAQCQVGLQLHTQSIYGPKFKNKQDYFYPKRSPDKAVYINQVFCSTLNLFYSWWVQDGRKDHSIKNFVRPLLGVMYEATLRAALYAHKNNLGNGKVVLTLIGGGVFDNPIETIVDAIKSQIGLIKESGLNVQLIIFSWDSRWPAIYKNSLLELEKFEIQEKAPARVSVNNMVSQQQQIMRPSSAYKTIAEHNRLLNRETLITKFQEDCVARAKQNAFIPPHEKNDSTVRLMTYNVFQWQNPGKLWSGANCDQMASVIKKINPDIIVLQEADVIPEYAQTFKDMGYEYQVFAHTTISGWPTFGNWVLSKYPFKETPKATLYQVDQDRKFWEIRSYVDSLISLPHNQTIRLYGTHLDVWDKVKVGVGAGNGSQKLLSVAEIEELLGIIKQDNENNSVVLADFNSVRRKDYEGSEEVWDVLAKSADFKPNTGPLDTLTDHGFINCFEKIGWNSPRITVWTGSAVDFIYVSKAWNLPILGCYVYYSAVSDHLPIIMDFKVAAQ